MVEYFEAYKTLILVVSLSGFYFFPVEKIIHGKWILGIFKILPLFFIFCLVIFNVFQIKYFFFDEGNLFDKVFATSTLGFTLLPVFIFFTFYRNRWEYVKMWEWWEENFNDDIFPENREKLIAEGRETVIKWVKNLPPSSVFVMFCYIIYTFLDPKKTLSHPSGIPYRNQSPDFELVVLLDWVVGTLGFVTIQIHDALTMAFLLLENAQLLHLKETLARIVSIISVDESGNIRYDGHFTETMSENLKKSTFYEIEKKIRIWVVHHQKLLCFHEKVKKAFITSMTIKSFVLFYVLCTIGSLVAVNLSKPSIFVITTYYCCSNYLLHYVNVTHADSIAELGRTVFDEAFGQSWHVYPSHIKSSLSIIALRTNRTVQFVLLHVFPYSSKSFMMILSSGYSFLTFLHQVTNRVQGSSV